MFQYHCLNPIAEKGLKLFGDNYKKSETVDQCDAILVRSAKMHDMELPESVKVIARAGAGVNNIPVKDCAEKGVVVFNTPGANANGVKELVLAGMLLASRDIVGGIEWVAKEKDQEDIDKLAEKQKKQFAGCEIMGKKLGIIGLGAIGEGAAQQDEQTAHVIFAHFIYGNADRMTPAKTLGCAVGFAGVLIGTLGNHGICPAQCPARTVPDRPRTG